MKLLDVRTDAEWAEGHITGAMHFDVQRMMGGELPDLAREEEIGVYCRSGARAAAAAQLLTKAGYTNVRIIGGLDDARAYGAVVKGDEA